jgi:hypothetical protein
VKGSNEVSLVFVDATGKLAALFLLDLTWVRVGRYCRFAGTTFRPGIRADKGT